jgi:hypothetical protein
MCYLLTTTPPGTKTLRAQEFHEHHEAVVTAERLLRENHTEIQIWRPFSRLEEVTVTRWTEEEND